MGCLKRMEYSWLFILQEEKKGSPIDFTGTTGTTSTPATTAQPTATSATAVNPEKPTL